MKVLYVISQLDIGGIECWLRDLIKLMKLKSPDIEVHILIDKPHKGFLENDLIESGVKLIRASSSKHSKIKYLLSIYKIMKKNKYDVVHSNVSYTNGIILMLSFFANVKVKVSHIHSDRRQEKSSFFKKLINNILRILLEVFSNIKLAVSDESSRSYIFSKSVKIVPCGINTKLDVTEILIDSLGWNSDSDVVLCSVGRLVPVKNHEFIINLLVSLDVKYKYLIVGEGILYSKLSELIKILNLDDRVYLCGVKENIISFMSSNADLFVFPSLHEGLGVAAIEAQISGLPVIASVSVPGSIEISDLVKFVDLNNKKQWLDTIKQLSYKKNKLIINSSIYTIENNHDELVDIYNENVR